MAPLESLKYHTLRSTWRSTTEGMTQIRGKGRKRTTLPAYQVCKSSRPFPSSSHPRPSHVGSDLPDHTLTVLESHRIWPGRPEESSSHVQLPTAAQHVMEEVGCPDGHHQALLVISCDGRQSATDGPIWRETFHRCFLFPPLLSCLYAQAVTDSPCPRDALPRIPISVRRTPHSTRPPGARAR